MSAGGIIRIEHDRDRPYVVVSKTLTNDKRLSFRLRGMLVYLIGKPPTWQARMSEIQAAGVESEDAVRSMFIEGRKYGYIKSIARREKGRVTFEHIIYESPITPACPDILNEDGTVYVAPTKRGKPNPANRTGITEPGFPSSETPVLVSTDSATNQEQVKKREEAPAAPALGNAQEAPQEIAPAQTPAADAAAPDEASEATAEPVQDSAQTTANAEPGKATSPKKVPGGAARRGREPQTAEEYLRRLLSHKFVDDLLEELQPLGVNRRADWFTLPLDRVKELAAEAQRSHEKHKVKVPTRLKDLLDEECRRRNTPTPETPAAGKYDRSAWSD